MNKNSQNFLILNNICKSYPGVKALDNVSLNIKCGEIHSLCGENGSGKSTMIKIISGVVRPDEGEIIIKDNPIKNVRAIDAIRNGIYIVYQDLSLFPNLTVAENIYIEEIIKKNNFYVNWQQIERGSREALEKINVKINPNSYVKDLSVANKVLVEIAKSITKKAELIIMDEPTSSLTKKEVDALFGVIMNLKKEGISILFVSHKLYEVIEISDVITILRDGKLVGNFDAKNLTIKEFAYLVTGQKTKDETFISKKVIGKTNRHVLMEIRDLSW